MTGDGIGFGEISDVYRNERQSKTLTRLPVNFYSKAEEHMHKLREEHCAAISVPNNPNAMMLWDQISKLEKRLQHIYDIRERKIALASLDKMAGAPQPDNMTKRDKALYDKLVETLMSFRTLPEPQDCAPQPAQPVPEKTDQLTAADGMPNEGAREPEESVVVHVLEDIPTFVSLRDTYNLKKDDMVTLPGQFAQLLSAKGKVRIVGS